MSSEEDVVSVMSYLCSWNKVHAVQIFLQRLWDGHAAEVP